MAKWTDRLGQPPSALAIAALALALAIAGAFVWPRDVLTGWLAAAVVAQCVPMTAVLLLMMMRLIRGAWEAELHQICSAASRLALLCGAAFLPVLIGERAIYDWPVRTPTSAFQGAYLTTVPFVAQTFLWFALLAIVSRLNAVDRISGAVAAIGLILFTLLGSLVAIAWLESLDPDFTSSGFGIQILSMEITAGFMILLLLRLARGPMPQRLQVLSGLLLTMVLIWAYLQFMPFLVTWSGNLPKGVAWYAARTVGPWGAAIDVIMIVSAVTIIALLFKRVRCGRNAMLVVAGVGIATKLVEVAWFVLPGRGLVSLLSYALVLLGIGLAGTTILRTGEGRQQQRTGREAAA